MRKILVIAAVLVCYTAAVFAQEAKMVKPYQMYNTLLIKPMKGHEVQFENAVKAHNAKFHAKAPFQAKLWLISEGSGSDGWYLWTMGPQMYRDMDNQPQGDKEHDDDWAKNIDSQVAEYGESTIWRLQDELSYTPANYNPEHLDVWSMDIKPGKRYEFSELMKKWKAMWEAKKYPFSLRVFYNDLFSAKGKDAGIVFSFANYAVFDQDISWRNDYEAMYGPGSWDNFWNTWNDCVASTDEHLRKLIK